MVVRSVAVRVAPGLRSVGARHAVRIVVVVRCSCGDFCLRGGLGISGFSQAFQDFPSFGAGWSWAWSRDAVIVSVAADGAAIAFVRCGRWWRCGRW